MRTPFEHAEEATKVFYSKVFYNVLLNLNAVQMGFYDVLLCESDDPLASLKWRQAMPSVITRMRHGLHQKR